MGGRYGEDGAEHEPGLADYFREVSRYPLLAKEEEHRLLQEARAGSREARAYLAVSNLRLVVSVAKNYAGRGLPFLDIIEYGNVGLLRAIDLFRPEEDVRFSTYATWWIQQGIRRALTDTVSPVRLPAYLAPKLGRWHQASRRLTQELRRPPTIEELARACDVPMEGIEFDIFASAITLSRHLEHRVSLQPSEPDDSETAGALRSRDGSSPADAFFTKWEADQINGVVGRLGEKLAFVVRMRYGLDGMRSHTLGEIGEVFQLSRERVRQLENKALRLLRRLLKAANLSPERAGIEPQPPAPPKKKKKKGKKGRACRRPPQEAGGDAEGDRPPPAPHPRAASNLQTSPSTVNGSAGNVGDPPTRSEAPRMGS